MESSGNAASRSAGGPLEGRRVIVTRRREDAEGLRNALLRRGAIPLDVPTVSLSATAKDHPDRLLLAEPSRYTHVVFTSANAVRFFLDALGELTPLRGAPATAPAPGSASRSRAWLHTRTACVGERTRDALRAAGWPCHFTSSGRDALDLARQLLAEERLGPHHHVLAPGSDLARGTLPETLRAGGVPTTTVVVYENRPAGGECAEQAAVILEDPEQPDAATFCSPSAVHGFRALAGARFEALFRSGVVPIATIGPTTSEAVREAGCPVAVEAASPSMEALVGALESLFRG